MTNPNTNSAGNIKGQWVLTVTLSPATVAATSSAEQTFTVTGVQLGDMIDVQKAGTPLVSGLGIVNSRVTAANTIGITFQNTTNYVQTPAASETYYLQVTRAENLTTSNVPALSILT
jgi:hypothetical protein